MMSALIAGELEVTIPSWLNDGRVDQPTQGMSDSSVYQVQKGRREGFVSTELHIDHAPDQTGKILSVTMEGYKADGSKGIHVLTE